MNMENMFGIVQRKNSQHLRYEQFVPSSGLTEDSDNYCLIIDLPGFKRDQVKLHLDDYGRIVASGERQVNEYKHIRFEQSYKAPHNSNIEDTTAKFEDEILYIIIPKKLVEVEENEPPQQHHGITNIPEEDKKEIKQNVGPEDEVPKPFVKDRDQDQTSGHVAAIDGHDVQETRRSHHQNRDSDEETHEDEVPKPFVQEVKDRGQDQTPGHVDAIDGHDEQETTRPSHHHRDSDDEGEEKEREEEFHDTKMEVERNNEVGLIMEEIVKKLKKNKGFLITAVLAFSLGVLVSQKFQTNEKYEIPSTI